MIFVSITEASDLTGKSIPTLYQCIKEGKLSANNERINTSELIQLYGPLRTITDYRRENDFLHNLTTHLKHDKERLYQINDLLRKSNTDLKQEKEKLYRVIMGKQKLSSAEIVQITPNEILEPKVLEQPIELVEVAVIDQPIKETKLEEIYMESLIQRLIRKIFF